MILWIIRHIMRACMSKMASWSPTATAMLSMSYVKAASLPNLTPRLLHPTLRIGSQKMLVL